MSVLGGWEVGLVRFRLPLLGGEQAGWAGRDDRCGGWPQRPSRRGERRTGPASGPICEWSGWCRQGCRHPTGRSWPNPATGPRRGGSPGAARRRLPACPDERPPPARAGRSSPADQSPASVSTCPGVATRAPSSARVAWSYALEDRPRCPRRHPPCESAIKRNVPTRGSPTSHVGEQHPCRP